MGTNGKTIGVGIVGAGWGANHARVVAELGARVAVRALCARRRERLLPLAAELGLPEGALETSWERLVARADIDLVVVTAPDALHHPISLAAIGAGKAVFCDKPLAMDAAQAKEMLDAADGGGGAPLHRLHLALRPALRHHAPPAGGGGGRAAAIHGRPLPDRAPPGAGRSGSTTPGSAPGASWATWGCT